MPAVVFDSINQALIKVLSRISIKKLRDCHSHDPYEFYLLKDDIDDIQYSSRAPNAFSRDRTSPIIVINNHVELKEADNDHHFDLIQHYKEKNKLDDDIDFNVSSMNEEDTLIPDNITETAAGSVFNKVVLLEYIQGNKDKIKQTLINHGFKKVYINTNSVNSCEYKRIAKRYI